jgi:hypothetical protein
VRRRPGLAVFLGYVLVAFLFLGLPLFVERGDRYVGYGYDPQIFIWAFAWWPHAIAHGLNPFVTHAVWAPDGVNLAWTTTVPGLALLFSPLTAIVGPFASYDTAAILMPAVAAWTAFALCRYLARSLWAAIVGGYLFGFSSYLLAQGGGGHLQLSSVFLLPLVALLVLRFLDSDLDVRGLVLRLGPVLGLQLLIGTEVAFTMTLGLAIALALGFGLVPARRPRIAALLAPLAGAYVFGALLTSPFLYFLLSDFRRSLVGNPDGYLADVVNFVVPTKIVYAARAWASPISAHFPGNVTEEDAYLGVPTLLAMALYARGRLRTPGVQFLLVALTAAVVVSLGVEATVDGHGLFPMPWRLVHRLPLFENVLTSRLTVYVALIAAVMAALWVAARPAGPLRWLLPVAAVLATFPYPARGGFATGYSVPAFFTDSAYRACVPAGSIVLPLPIREFGDELLWQADASFRFDMAGGEIGPVIPPSFETPGAMEHVTDGKPVRAGEAGVLRAFIAAKHVTTVVVDGTQAKSWSAALDRIAKPRAAGGVVLYTVSGPAPACPA